MRTTLVLLVLLCAAMQAAPGGSRSSVGPSAGARLVAAVTRGDQAAIAAIIKASPRAVRFADATGATPLHYAAALGRPDLATMLLEAGADISARKRDGVTPLHVAAALDKVEAVRVLVAAGADANVKDKMNRTPISLARERGQQDIIDLLGVDKSPTGESASTTLGSSAALPIVAGSASDITIAQFRALVARFGEVSPNGQWKVPNFVRDSPDGRAQAIRVSTGAVSELKNESFYCLRQGYGFWSPDSGLLSSAHEGRLVRYDLDKGLEPVSLTPPGEKWNNASVSPDGKLVAYENSAGYLTVADLADPRRREVTKIQVSRIGCDSFNINKLYWSKDGSRILVEGNTTTSTGKPRAVCRQVPIRYR